MSIQYFPMHTTQIVEGREKSNKSCWKQNVISSVNTLDGIFSFYLICCYCLASHLMTPTANLCCIWIWLIFHCRTKSRTSSLWSIKLKSSFFLLSQISISCCKQASWITWRNQCHTTSLIIYEFCHRLKSRRRMMRTSVTDSCSVLNRRCLQLDLTSKWCLNIYATFTESLCLF